MLGELDEPDFDMEDDEMLDMEDPEAVELRSLYWKRVCNNIKRKFKQFEQ